MLKTERRSSLSTFHLPRIAASAVMQSPNAQFYGLTALGELKCPACEFPLPVDDFYDSESGDNSGDDVIVDNAFENEGDEHEGGEQDLEENSPDHSAEEVVVMISDGEYHESDFNSEEKDA
ncbi:hypothetical protein L914_07941 [Phytophthora nicotianae]|uniref:Uncharacterized protein n=1 Tax=Phytophthora nicotianae TaxID=4792 RepID=W2NHD6_PHYNI|nr:hypothetical protein L914_07941 [Phytophthora nicotianae]